MENQKDIRNWYVCQLDNKAQVACMNGLINREEFNRLRTIIHSQWVD